MRPLLFILGLAFVNTMLIANVDAIKCYFELSGSDLPRGEVDCDDVAAKKGWPKGTFKECGILEATNNEGETTTISNCLLGPECGNTVDGITYRCTKRCNSDMCNSDSDPPNRGTDPPNRSPDPPNRGPEPVNAIKCYAEVPDEPVVEADCDEAMSQLEDVSNVPRGTLPRPTECFTAEGNADKNGKKVHQFVRGCLIDAIKLKCRDKAVHCTTCGDDLCNGGPDPLNKPPTSAVTSTTPAPLLIAVITGVIAAVGF